MALVARVLPLYQTMCLDLYLAKFLHLAWYSALVTGIH
jgi:hypothetical protein